MRGSTRVDLALDPQLLAERLDLGRHSGSASSERRAVEASGRLEPPMANHAATRPAEASQPGKQRLCARVPMVPAVDRSAECQRCVRSRECLRCRGCHGGAEDNFGYVIKARSTLRQGRHLEYRGQRREERGCERSDTAACQTR